MSGHEHDHGGGGGLMESLRESMQSKRAKAVALLAALGLAEVLFPKPTYLATDWSKQAFGDTVGFVLRLDGEADGTLDPDTHPVPVDCDDNSQGNDVVELARGDSMPLGSIDFHTSNGIVTAKSASVMVKRLRDGRLKINPSDGKAQTVPFAQGGQLNSDGVHYKITTDTKDSSVLVQHECL